MSAVIDFRLANDFDAGRVNQSGKFVARSVYWKLYFVENAFRVVINSVLSSQINRNWWDVAVDSKTKTYVERIRRSYLQNPGKTSPGRHSIYYLYLWQLGEIIRANSNLFLPLIPKIDEWIKKIEQIRLPRNVVGHMNFPNKRDRKLIDNMYSDCRSLIRSLESSGVLLMIPEV